VVSVAQQAELEGELVGERGIRGGGIEADAENFGVLGLVFSVEVAEPATLDGSTRGVGDRVEPQHHRLTRKIGERGGFAVMVDDLERGGGIAGLQHRSLHAHS
jgi:hypothetical protein